MYPRPGTVTNPTGHLLSSPRDSRAPQIFALGGGGFSMEPGDTRIDDFTLAASGEQTPNVCFLPTASGDSSAQIDAFYAAFGPERAQASHVDLFRRKRANIAAQVQAADVLYIGGGNTANLLAVWRLHGVDQLVTDAYRAGAVLVGMSAGASCLFDGSLTDSFGAPLVAFEDGLGLISGTFCAHYNRGKRRARYHDAVASSLGAGFGVDEGAALHFVDGELTGVLTTSDDATAYAVRKGAGVEEVALPARKLEPV